MLAESTLPIMGTKPQYSRSVIGAKIQRLRKARGWSQADLGASIGRQQSRVAKWELGQGKPDPQDILRLANALGVSMRFLCDDTLLDPKEEEPEGGMTKEMDEDMKLLLALVKKMGVKRVLDKILDVECQDDEPPGPAKLVSTHRRPNKAE